jgi:hypothetical protein
MEIAFLIASKNHEHLIARLGAVKFLSFGNLQANFNVMQIVAFILYLFMGVFSGLAPGLI